MANILVYIELVDDRPSPSSLEALGEGRRIASFLGATLYAVLPCAVPPHFGDDDAIAVLSRHGADKVILSAGPDLALPALYATHGYTMTAAAERVPPSLVLLAATPGGRDLAPRIAARLGAAFVSEPAVEYGPRTDLVLSRKVYGGVYRRRLATEEVERPIVATFTPGSYRTAAGSEEAEVIVVGSGDAVLSPVSEISRRADEAARLETARIVVTAGAGVSAEVYPRVRELARVLGGEVAVTRSAVERGLDSAEREVGVGARRVAPRLYIACGASGSAAHLAGVSADAQIVAVNIDPDAPILRVASYALVGDVASLVEQLIVAFGGDKGKDAAEQAS